MVVSAINRLRSDRQLAAYLVVTKLAKAFRKLTKRAPIGVFGPKDSRPSRKNALKSWRNLSKSSPAQASRREWNDSPPKSVRSEVFCRRQGAILNARTRLNFWFRWMLMINALGLEALLS